MPILCSGRSGDGLSSSFRVRPLAVATWQESTRQLARFRMRRSRPQRDLSRVAVVGALGKNNGIAQGARLQYEQLLSAGRSVQLVDATAALRNPFARIEHRPATAYIFHIGVPETSMLLHGVLPEAAKAWRIGYWAWELPDPPSEWRRFEALVSEVWVPSRFTAEALGQLYALPIAVVPHHTPAQSPRTRNFSLPFTVLTMADSRSSFSRKNPMGALEAFRRAFGESPAARLIIKLSGRSNDIEKLGAAARDLPNVEVIGEHLDDEDLRSLYRSSDVFLSLHRAEGFGLPILEAMAHGVPVIGTNWSGSTQFMTEANSTLIPFNLIPVEDAAGVYPKSSCWADPDIDAAAAHLMKLALDESHYLHMAQAAHDSVVRTHFVAPL